jgi:transcriptional regulator with XRE-family HTH domain
MNIGSKLKKARESKRFSQQEVAELLHISQKTLSNIESDKSTPSIEQLSKMGELYEVNVLEMLSNEGINFSKNETE